MSESSHSHQWGGVEWGGISVAAAAGGVSPTGKSPIERGCLLTRDRGGSVLSTALPRGQHSESPRTVFFKRCQHPRHGPPWAAALLRRILLVPVICSRSPVLST